MATNCEYETTCGFIFDSDLYGRIKDAVISKCNNKIEIVEECVDTYRDPDNASGRYRQILRSATPLVIDDVSAEHVWDHKTTVYVQEVQTPYIERTRGRVVFTTCTYKVSNERSMSRDEWMNTVREDHVSGRYVRISNKRRICFYAGAFDTEKLYTRVSVGEKSTYGGTLEARSTCDSIYYMEIENETKTQLDRFAVKKEMHRLCEFLFELVPYELVQQAMSAFNTCSVQRERVDNIFDSFKRNFQNYTARSADLRRVAARDTAARSSDTKLRFYVMPKWDGVRAVGLYYREGYLLVKDAYGRLSGFNTCLPFDNDMVLQLEAVDKRPGDERQQIGLDSAGRYYVITELMAVLIKSQNTMFQVYSRNTIARDTCRNIGNIVDGVSIKIQFEDNAHVCNLYRLLPAATSLYVLYKLTSAERGIAHGIIILTSVVRISKSHEKVLKRMDRFIATRGLDAKSRSIDKFSNWLPAYMRNQSRFKDNCEGIILAYTLDKSYRRPYGWKVEGMARAEEIETANALADHGYFKLKRVDTVDLELNLSDGTLKSADGTLYTAEGLPTLYGGNGCGTTGETEDIPNWAERPVPVKNKRAIVECYFNGKQLQFFKDRCDKSRPDSDSKIIATDKAIFTVCRVMQP